MRASSVRQPLSAAHVTSKRHAPGETVSAGHLHPEGDGQNGDRTRRQKRGGKCDLASPTTDTRIGERFQLSTPEQSAWTKFTSWQNEYPPSAHRPLIRLRCREFRGHFSCLDFTSQRVHLFSSVRSSDAARMASGFSRRKESMFLSSDASMRALQVARQ